MSTDRVTVIKITVERHGYIGGQDYILYKQDGVYRAETNGHPFDAFQYENLDAAIKAFCTAMGYEIQPDYMRPLSLTDVRNA